MVMGTNDGESMEQKETRKFLTEQVANRPGYAIGAGNPLWS